MALSAPLPEVHEGHLQLVRSGPESAPTPAVLRRPFRDGEAQILGASALQHPQGFTIVRYGGYTAAAYAGEVLEKDDELGGVRAVTIEKIIAYTLACARNDEEFGARFWSDVEASRNSGIPTLDEEKLVTDAARVHLSGGIRGGKRAAYLYPNAIMSYGESGAHDYTRDMVQTFIPHIDLQLIG